MSEQSAWAYECFCKCTLCGRKSALRAHPQVLARNADVRVALPLLPSQPQLLPSQPLLLLLLLPPLLNPGRKLRSRGSNGGGTSRGQWLVHSRRAPR